MAFDVTRKPEDESLVRDYLAAVEGLSQEQAAARAPGITQTDVSRWRRDEWEWISDKKRSVLQRFRNGGGGGLVADPEAPALEDPVSTAADIIRVVGRAGYIRQAFKQADRENQANLGYILAQRHKLPPDEMRRILEWRDEILQGDEDD